MNQEEIKKYNEYMMKREELLKKQRSASIIIKSLVGIVFSILFFVFGLREDYILAIISFVISIIFFALYFPEYYFYDKKIYDLNKENELLLLKMKGYKKQLSRKGFNVNVNSNENQQSIASENSNLLRDKLKELMELKNEGILNDEEYEIKRKQIIEKY